MTDNFYSRVRPKLEAVAREMQQRDGLAAWEIANAFLDYALCLGTALTTPERTASILRDIAARYDADAARRRDEARPPPFH